MTGQAGSDQRVRSQGEDKAVFLRREITSVHESKSEFPAEVEAAVEQPVTVFVPSSESHRASERYNEDPLGIGPRHRNLLPSWSRSKR